MGNLYHMEFALQSALLKELKIDKFIVAASGDERAYSSVAEMLKNGFRIENLVVFKFERQCVAPDDPMYDAYNQYSSFPIPTTEMYFKSDLIALDSADFDGKNVVVDITGFSIPNLFRMLFVMKEILSIRKLHMVYTEPKYYIFGGDTFGSYSYFIGEREYRALDEFYISGDDGRELLTIFLGFDRMTSSIVKEAVDPIETVLVNGFPSMSPKLKDVSLLNNKELVSVLGRPAFSVKTNNPFSAYNALQRIQKDHPDTLINVCVLGTKAMALGAGIYALQNKNVKISYAYTKKCAASISRGISNMWYYCIDL